MKLRRLWFLVALGAVACVGVAVLAIQHMRKPAISWNSPVMASIQKEWEALNESFAPTMSKDNIGERRDQLDKTFAKGLSKEDLRHLAATSDTLPFRARDQSIFQWELLRYMVQVFTESGDRESLVTLLSRHFPDETITFYSPIEFYLAYYGREKLNDPILVLGEAYSRCNAPEAAPSNCQCGSPELYRLGHPREGRWGVCWQRHELVQERKGASGD